MRDSWAHELLYGSPLAILEDKLASIVAVVEAHTRGIPRQTTLAARQERGAREAARTREESPSMIGVLPIHGSLIPRGNDMTESSGIASVDRLAADFRSLVANPDVDAVVLDIDSPGGVVYGIAEFAAEIRAARGTKPIVAQAWDLAASAAYYIASAADEIVVTPSGEVGSIGVVMLHTDFSKAFDEAGITNTIIRAGKFKAEANHFEPLTEEAREFEQGRVDDYYKEFVSDVAKGRGVTASVVRNEFGEGRLLGAKDALGRGMVDRIGTFSETVRRLGTPQQRAKVGRRIEDRVALSRAAMEVASFERGELRHLCENLAPADRYTVKGDLRCFKDADSGAIVCDL